MCVCVSTYHVCVCVCVCMPVLLEIIILPTSRTLLFLMEMAATTQHADTENQLAFGDFSNLKKWHKPPDIKPVIP